MMERILMWDFESDTHVEKCGDELIVGSKEARK